MVFSKDVEGGGVALVSSHHPAPQGEAVGVVLMACVSKVCVVAMEVV